MALQIKTSKGMASEQTEMNRESVESSSPCNNSINAPKYGTVVPNRVFVGGISPATTETDLAQLFSNYGHVLHTKIISDRAGVSKGYGFVTFSTEDEAKQLQKDAENIVLKERRLNIAPAIKKQGFIRSTYETAQAGTTSPIPIQTNQIIRQNGVTIAFQNGMAFFPQQAIQHQSASSVATVQNHVEPMPIYATGNPYGNMGQANTSPGFPFPYVPQGQVFYQTAHYPYHVPIEGCYQIEGHNGVMMASQTSGGEIIPTQYYLAQPSPQLELAYYNPQSQMTQVAITSPQEGAVTPPIYAAPRTYESNSSPILYAEKNGVESPKSVTNLTTLKEENSRKSPNNETAIVAMNRTSKYKDRDINVRPKTRGGGFGDGKGGGGGRGICAYKGRRLGYTQSPQYPQNDNNNNADLLNKNSITYTPTCSTVAKSCKSTSTTFQYHQTNNMPSSSSHPVRYNHYFSDPTRNTPPYPFQMPQFPYYPSNPRQIFTSAYTGSTTRRGFCPRNKYGGRGKGKWFNRDNTLENVLDANGCEMANTLTPPITPRSSQDNEVTQTDDVVSTIKTLSI